MSSFSGTPSPQTVLGVAVLAEWLSQSSSICSPEWNVFMLDLIKEEPLLTALQSGIWNCENLEGCNRHLSFCALVIHFLLVYVPQFPSEEPDFLLLS